MATHPDLDSYDRLAAAYRQAAGRDPRRCGFGYLAGDPATGAHGDFLWFATAAEMLDFLCTNEVALLRFDAPDAARMAASLRRAIGSARDVSRLARDRLSAAFEGWCEILWIGTFAELCAKGGSFEKVTRAAFRAALGLGAHAGPIAEDELERFVAFATARDAP